MMRPGLLLSILIAIATGAGVYLRGVYLYNSAPAKVVPIGQGQTEAPVPSELTRTTADATEAVLLNQAFHVSSLRRLPFQQDLAFVKADEAEIKRVWDRQVRSHYPSDSLARFGLALQMLGLVSMELDLQATYTSAPLIWEGAVYDGIRGQMLYSEACNPAESMAAKQQLAQQLMLMLLDQRFAWRESQLLTEVNFDQAMAQKAFVMADAAWHMLRYTETDANESILWAKAQAMGSALPPPFAEMELLPYREGVHFCQEITRANVSLDSMYQQMPTSTAQLLHPERFFRNPPYTPRTLRWFQLDLKGLEPAWDNVIGEALLRGWLRQHAPMDEADLMASSIDGDRMILYHSGKDGPQLLWKTAWRNVDRAQAFVAFLVSRVSAIFGIEEVDTGEAGNHYYAGVLDLEISGRDEVVTLVRSTTPEWRVALTNLAERSAFQKRP